MPVRSTTATGARRTGGFTAGCRRPCLAAIGLLALCPGLAPRDAHAADAEPRLVYVRGDAIVKVGTDARAPSTSLSPPAGTSTQEPQEVLAATVVREEAESLLVQMPDVRTDAGCAGRVALPVPFLLRVRKADLLTALTRNLPIQTADGTRGMLRPGTPVRSTATGTQALAQVRHVPDKWLPVTLAAGDTAPMVAAPAWTCPAPRYLVSFAATIRLFGADQRPFDAVLCGAEPMKSGMRGLLTERCSTWQVAVPTKYLTPAPDSHGGTTAGSVGASRCEIVWQAGAQVTDRPGVLLATLSTSHSYQAETAPPEGPRVCRDVDLFAADGTALSVCVPRAAVKVECGPPESGAPKLFGADESGDGEVTAMPFGATDSTPETGKKPSKTPKRRRTK